MLTRLSKPEAIAQLKNDGIIPQDANPADTSVQKALNTHFQPDNPHDPETHWIERDCPVEIA